MVRVIQCSMSHLFMYINIIIFAVCLLHPLSPWRCCTCCWNFPLPSETRTRRRGRVPRFLLGTCNVTPTPRWWFLLIFFPFFWPCYVFGRGETGRPALDRENSGQVFGNRLSESKIKLPNYGGEWRFLFLHPVYNILIRNFCIISRWFNCTAGCCLMRGYGLMGATTSWDHRKLFARS